MSYRSRLLGGCLSAVVAAGCGSPDAGDGPIVIRSGDEYSVANKNAADLTKGILDKKAAGEPLTAADATDLKHAVQLYDGMVAFMPTNLGPTLVAGQALQTIGEDAKAIDHFKAYLAGQPAKTTPQLLVTYADAHWLLSDSYFKLKNYQAAVGEATKALEMFPGTPNYLLARASAYTQQKEYAKAKKDIKVVLVKEPNNQRAYGLARLLGLRVALPSSPPNVEGTPSG